MAKIVARNATVFGGGTDFSGRSNSIALGIKAETPEATAFGDSTRQRVPGGIKDCDLSVDGFFAVGASAVDARMSGLLSASAYWGVYPAGGGTSNIGKEFGGILGEYNPAFDVSNVAAVSWTVAGSPPLLDVKSLGYKELSAQTSASAALPSVDFSGSTNDLWGIFRLTAIGGTTPEISASLQHSSDDSTFTTAIVFTTASTGNVAYAASANSGSRYRRLKYVFNGTSPFSASFQASAGKQI